MELYEYARPGLMAGKKVLYVHGFASSGQTGSVKTLRLLGRSTMASGRYVDLEKEQRIKTEKLKAQQDSLAKAGIKTDVSDSLGLTKQGKNNDNVKSKFFYPRKRERAKAKTEEKAP